MQILNDLNSKAKLMIKIADIFGLSEERDAFIFMFVQFSGLELIENRELTDKNIAFLFSLLDLGTSFPNSLNSGWKLILNSALKLEWLYPLQTKIPVAKKSKNKKDVYQSNINSIFEKISIEQITKIYIQSSNLNEVNLMQFLKSLFEIIREKKMRDQIISILQKISETCGINIDRTMATWEIIWPVVSSNII
jgi:hypothetical protein